MNKEIEQDVHLHCSIPLHPTKVVGAKEYQIELENNSLNKGEMLRVCLRVLSSLGYNASASEKLRKKIAPYLNDFDG